MSHKIANIVIFINHNGMHYNHEVSVNIRENIPSLNKIKHTINNCILSGAEISSSEGFDQIHIIFVLHCNRKCLCKIMKAYYPVMSVCICTASHAWLSLNACSVHSKHMSSVTDTLNLSIFAKRNYYMANILSTCHQKFHLS